MESDENKFRPVIVMSKPCGKFHIVSIVPISSRPSPDEVDVTLNDWQSAGLTKPSTARVHRITPMLQADLVSEMGKLSAHDVDALKQALHQLFGL